MFTGPCIIVIVEEWKTKLMSLAILFHFLCAQNVSDINIDIIRSLRLCCCVTTSVVLFSVRCVLEVWCGWLWVVFVLQAVLQPAKRTPHKKWNKIASDIKLVFHSSTNKIILSQLFIYVQISNFTTCFGHNSSHLQALKINVP